VANIVLKDLRIKPFNNFGGDPNGLLIVFKPPDPQRLYYIGVDVGTGQGLTNSVLHVLERGDEDMPDVQVAEFACNFLDPHQLAVVVDKVGWLYHSEVNDLPAEVAIEVWPGPGEGTQYDLMTFYNYPNIHIRQVFDSQRDTMTTKYGWRTTPATRRDIVLWGEHQFSTGQWMINSPWMLDEMASFTLDKAMPTSVQDSEVEVINAAKSTARAKRGSRDDRVLAGFIAEWVAHSQRAGRDPAVTRAIKQEEKQKRGDGDYINTDVSYEDMMNMW